MHNLIIHYGYLGLFVLTLLESACIPIPSEITLTVAGSLAAPGAGSHLNVVAVIIVATLGELVGGFIAWGVGRTGGRAAVLKFGKYIMLDVKDLEKAESFFKRRGNITVLFGRILPVVRTFISLPAGTGELGPVQFGIFTVVGSAIWCTALGLIGYFLGDQLHLVNTINTILSNVGYLIAAVAVVLIGLFVFHRSRLKKHQKETETAN
jgi:membrane protein DedA with SNARE-associated domain